MQIGEQNDELNFGRLDLYFGWLASWLAGQRWIYNGFTLFYVDFEGISLILGLGCPIPCGGLWRAVASCGSLWRKAVAPIYYHALSLGLAGWQDGVWQAGWMAGWLGGWMVGITAVT